MTITAGIAVPGEIKSQLQSLATDKQNDADLGELFFTLSNWCAISEKPVVLMIDEVDSAAPRFSQLYLPVSMM